ncbi:MULTISPECIES: DUF4136 domain-containing protein [unclassified Novosphingobium]|uniref:DUF4136 domain-containing protein n=1 Tax=unclassified Novosphingobium TaxID=2644732 RepID=UPI0025FD006D|nr:MULTISPECIES: DUF4136 domain-containing protein [unclassified Novosphingobium]HQS71149.1 DUF4136 domain-containing protein [Novosphingobium sp.]
MAQPAGGRWGGGMMDQRFGSTQRPSSQPSKSVEVTAFLSADAAPLLGKGPITVAAANGAEAEWKLPVYEAAVVDQLAKLGYDTAVSGAETGQIAQIGITHSVVVPEEQKRKPVSGAMEVGVSNRGSYQAMALNIDLSKPRKAIVATRLDVRIRDKATDRVLWEGHAEAQSREDDDGLDNGAIAAKLATALFARFAEAQVVPTGG